MSPGPVVTIGGSAGALEVLLRIVAQLSPAFSAPVVIVIHTSPDYRSYLPDLLSRAGPLPAHHARSGEPLLGGHLYVAPPDRHLLVNGETLLLSRGPKENHSRPSIDVMMRSAAATWGANVIGVILSGLLDDGTSGLWTIQRLGGRTLVQHPEEALYSSMPLSAIQQVRVDQVLPSAEIAGRLEQLVQDWTPAQVENSMSQEEQQRLELEVKAAAGQNLFETGFLKGVPLSPFTCPECHGVMVEINEGDLVRFRCHTGHAYSAATLLSDLRQAVDVNLWNTVRVLDENVMLLEHLAAQAEKRNRTPPTVEHRGELQARRELTRRLRQELETRIGGASEDDPPG